MNIDDKIQTARALVAEQEAREGQTWAIVRGLLGEIEEEIRTLRVEKERREVVYFTREQFAERLLVNVSSLKRAEARGEIKPALRIGSKSRYASWQLEYADEIFSKRRGPDGRAKMPGKAKIPDSRFQIHNSRDSKAA
jgi:hypothetical protein